MHIGNALIAWLVVAPQFSSCQSKGGELPWNEADSVVVVGTAHIGLRVSAWRDFMPNPAGTQGGSDLMVSLQIQSDAAPWPAGLVVDSAWVRSDQGLWATAPSVEERPELPNGLDLMLRAGPKWDTTVDVLVRLQSPEGMTYYLIRRDQSIGRTM